MSETKNNVIDDIFGKLEYKKKKNSKKTQKEKK